MSSISAISGKRPAASNSERVRNRPWSPVAMPVSRERQFISCAITRSIGCVPAIDTSKRPQLRRLRDRPSTIRPSAPLGIRESACTKHRISPRAAAAPAFICRARPAGTVSTWSARSRARFAVLSLLPPSATMISTPRRRSGCRLSSVATMCSASSSAGMMMDSDKSGPVDGSYFLASFSVQS